MARKKKRAIKNWFIVEERGAGKDAFMVKGDKKYRKNKKQYKVYGPYTLADARFQLYGG